jgi:glycosyltransferase involved in cell wall biosynthesis
MLTKTVILATENSHLVERSLRALRKQGGEPSIAWSKEELCQVLKGTTGPILCLKAGAVLAEEWRPIPASATGLPVLALDEYLLSEAKAIYTSNGKGLGEELEVVPNLESLDVEKKARLVKLPQLRTYWSKEIRVLQLVTTIQTGGAERMTLDLAHVLNMIGSPTWVGVTIKSKRAGFPIPPKYIDFSDLKNWEEKKNAIVRFVEKEQIDIVHAHLLTAQECSSLHETGIPIVSTLHNTANAWPEGMTGTHWKTDLLIACSKAVAKEIQNQGLTIPHRTVWNGINGGAYKPTKETRAAGKTWRKQQGWGDQDFVVISVANPRSQKRLDRIPAILNKIPRKVRWIIAGEAQTNRDGQEAQAALDHAIQMEGVNALQVHGAKIIPVLLAAADAFLSTSAHEGLSLAHLEALAAGVPCVVTNVGGAMEIAQETISGYTVLPFDAEDSQFAEALLKTERKETSLLPACFQRDGMGNRMGELYKSVLSQRRACDEEVWIVTNNYSMGGAQSSARRLLQTWKLQGIPVRTITIQETNPTKGSETLRAAGIPVHRMNPELLKQPEAIVQEMFGIGKRPKAILFWNLITAVKVHIAEHFYKSRIIDVSPGEMNFHSLESYFGSPNRKLPYRTTQEYGQLLYAGVVKFTGEQKTAEAAFGCPVKSIPNGIKVKPTSPKTGTKFKIGTACRISPQKCIEDLIEALKLCKTQNYEFHIAGRIENKAETYAQELKEMAEGLPIVWRGELETTDSFLTELDFFVMISEPAGCPNASLEAMAAGLAVVATDVGGASEQVVTGYTGILTPRKNAQALAAAIDRLAQNKSLREEYGKNAHQHMQTQFSIEAMSQNYLELVT